MRYAAYEVTIAAPVDVVWAHLTTAEGLARWIGPVATADPVPGGALRWTHANGATVIGRFLELAPPRRVVFSHGRGAPRPPRAAARRDRRPPAGVVVLPRRVVRRAVPVKPRADTLNLMVQQAELDAVFAALADPTRRAIVARLAQGEASVSELSAPFAMTLTAVAKHVRVLAAAGLVEHRKQGRVRSVRLAPAPLREAHAWLGDYGRFWEGQLDSLAAHVGGPARD